MRLIVMAGLVLIGCGSTQGPDGPTAPRSTVWSCNYATSCPSGIKNFKASFCDTSKSVAQSRTIAQCRQEQTDPKCVCSSEYCYDTGTGC